MSLKAFHIVFIALSILLTLGFGVWEIVEYSRNGGTGTLITAILSFAVGVGLIIYGITFLRKLKNISYL